MRPTWPLPVGGISQNLISRESKNREIRVNLAPRKFPGIRYLQIIVLLKLHFTIAHFTNVSSSLHETCHFSYSKCRN